MKFPHYDKVFMYLTSFVLCFLLQIFFFLVKKNLNLIDFDVRRAKVIFFHLKWKSIQQEKHTSLQKITSPCKFKTTFCFRIEPWSPLRVCIWKGFCVKELKGFFFFFWGTRDIRGNFPSHGKLQVFKLKRNILICIIYIYNFNLIVSK
jgi:hypothetical protein